MNWIVELMYLVTAIKIILYIENIMYVYLESIMIIETRNVDYKQ